MKDKEHYRTRGRRNTHRNKEIRNLLLIAGPRFAVLPTTPGDVSASAVDDHDHEEDEVEPGERTPVKEKKDMSVNQSRQSPNIGMPFHTRTEEREGAELT